MTGTEKKSLFFRKHRAWKKNRENELWFRPKNRKLKTKTDFFRQKHFFKASSTSHSRITSRVKNAVVVAAAFVVVDGVGAVVVVTAAAESESEKRK